MTIIMQQQITYNNIHHEGLVTKEGGELNKRFFGSDNNFTKLERIALTANGNLQRIFSSYYDCAVHVHVDSCTRRVVREEKNEMISSKQQQQLLGMYDTLPSSTNNDNSNNINDAIWDRTVHISIHNQTKLLCRATSIIHVKSSECIELIHTKKVGLGQLFRYLNRLPRFSLLDAGRTSSSIQKSSSSEFEGGMWRIYELESEEMICLIHEEFCADAWDH